MKRTLGIDLAGSWVFTPGAAGAGTIAFSGITLTLDQILVINNSTRNTIIYNFASAATGAASFTNNTLTLDADTSSHSASDRLLVYVEVEDELLAAIESLRTAIGALTHIVGGALPDSLGRMRVNAESAVVSSGTLTAVTSVTNAVPVGNVATLGSVPAQYPQFQIQGLYADSLRRNITVT
jgi:hypothetical protein